MSGSPDPTTAVSVQAALGQPPVTFNVDPLLAPVIQRQLTNTITYLVDNPTPYTPVESSFVVLNPDGTAAGALPTVPNDYSTAEYVYLTGTVATPGTITLPNQTIGSNNGFAGMIATFAGSETVIGGAGQNALVVTGAETNLTWDPRGGSDLDSIYAGGGNNNFTLDGTNYSVVVGSGDNTITAAQNLNPQTSAYGSNNAITTSGGNNLINLNAGANAVSSGGNDTINVSDAYNQITVTGNAVVSLAAGASDNQVSDTGAGMIYANGNGDSITAGNNTFVVIGGTGTSEAATLTGSAIGYAQGNASIDAPGGNYVIFSGNSNVATLGGGSFAYIATGSDTVSAVGSTFIYDGSGSLDFVGGSEYSLVEAGAGHVTALAGAGGLSAYGGSQGNNSLTGGSGTNNLYAGGTDDTLTGGSGTNNLHAGPGSTTMIGAANAALNNFVFNSNSAGTADVIDGFRTASDQITLGFGISVTTQTVTAGNLSLTLSDGTQISMTGITAPLAATSGWSGTVLT
ncbi:MAG TPA: calcium-binding protein [Acidiphilium sp.]